MRLLSVCILTMMLSGCLLAGIPADPASGSAFSKPASIPENQAILYVFRESRFFQGGAYPNVDVCGAGPRPLRNGGYLVIYANPGNCEITFSKGMWWSLSTSDMSLKLQPGKEYFLRFVMDKEELTVIPVGGVVAANVSGDASLVLVREEDALPILSTTKQSY